MSTEVRYEVRRTLRASADAVWLVLGDFGTEHRWTRTVNHCVRDTETVDVGTRRTCTLPRALMGRNEVTEVITQYVPGHSLAYVLEGPAGPFSRAGGKWSISPASGDSALLTVEGKFTPRNWLSEFVVWPLAKPFLRRLTNRVIAELERFVIGREENGGSRPWS